VKAAKAVATNKSIHMNIKKIKLGLSVELMNLEAENLLQGIKDAMQRFSHEVGGFVGLSLLEHSRLSASYSHREYALQYEHATLRVEVANNPFTKVQSIQNFYLTGTDRLAA
jgi:hypothetical protein